MFIVVSSGKRQWQTARCSCLRYPSSTRTYSRRSQSGEELRANSPSQVGAAPHARTPPKACGLRRRRSGPAPARSKTPRARDGGARGCVAGTMARTIVRACQSPRIWLFARILDPSPPLLRNPEILRGVPDVNTDVSVVARSRLARTAGESRVPDFSYLVSCLDYRSLGDRQGFDVEHLESVRLAVVTSELECHLVVASLRGVLTTRRWCASRVVAIQSLGVAEASAGLDRLVVPSTHCVSYSPVLVSTQGHCSEP